MEETNTTTDLIEMKEDNINRQSKGIHTNNSLVDQPKGTTRFVLNGVNETEEGDQGFISNEQSNQECYQLPEGYIPLGKVYIGNNETVIFSVAFDESSSEIGIADGNCNYITHVNSPDLGFKIDGQIDATFRLRRGCERTVYFVDGPTNNKPRYFNFDKPENFKTAGDWDPNKFELIRSYSSVPLFDRVEVLNSGGTLEPGSYNIAIQYLDENLNPTEWITSSEIIFIYNDDTSEDFLRIEGSINSEDDYRDFPQTDKSIRVNLSGLDQSFIFYRLAFIEATSANGLITNVRFTENIPTTKTFFIYTGTNFATEGTEEEIQLFDNIIESAGSIEQIENRLTLANTRGKQVNFCKLQKYASRIKSDMVTRKVFSNIISEGNTKNPTVKFEGVGYMPGEIYSFGIVYVFADGSLSPVYHIPGKSPNVDSNVTFTVGDTTYPMDNNNQSLNNLYIDNSACANEDFWGVDSEGNSLENQPVRHHRFPLRSSIGLPLVVQEEGMDTTSTTTFFQIELTATGNITLPVVCDPADTGCTPVDAPLFQARVEFTVDGVADALTVQIDPAAQSNPVRIIERGDFLSSNNVVITGIFESTDAGGIVDMTGGGVSPKGLTYSAELVEASFEQEGRVYSNEIFGIKFSGVEIPSTDDTNGEEIIGYYIVRNDRTEDEKTILDSGVLTPSVINSQYVSHGLLGPEFANEDKISKKIFGLIHPEHKFYDRKYSELTDVIQEGAFDIVDRKKSKSRYRDVTDGSSYDDDIHKDGREDRDGWSLKVITRDNITNFKRKYNFQKTSDEIDEIFYLNALESKDVEDDTITAYNISGDNRVGMLKLIDDYDGNILNTLPYVYLRREIADSYSTFRTLPYYKTSINLETTEETTVFNGDTYTAPMRYVNSVFWDNRLAERAGRTSVWNYIIGAILVVVGVVLAFFTAGASTVIVGAGIAIIGGGALFIASGVKRDTLVRAYQDEYDKGLRETALDDFVDEQYRYNNGLPVSTPGDDEIQWVGDCVTDMWFESQINVSLRYGMTSDAPTFLDAPGKIEKGNETPERIDEYFDVYSFVDDLLAPFSTLDKHMMDKLVVFNAERGDSREYIGHPLGEYYEINPDYNRINRQKIYFHLPIEYDCCSDCNEEFPHRIHYSEQSFQEELTDNYRVFLPNNYRDIEGEKGVITDVFRLQNNLYIHTQEAMWHLPQDIQERITGDVVSFIGTGNFFSIPPRKIVDTDIASAGNEHKWARLKTKNGVFFPFEKERKIFKFNGNELKPISDYGNEKWFKKNIKMIANDQYKKATGREYPYRDNPSNPFGTGFITVYDTTNERFIITKKDFTLTDEIVNNTDFELCTSGGELIIFNDYQQTIDQFEANGYQFVGIEDCRMKFSRTEFEQRTETRQRTINLPNTADIHVFFDTSGSFGQFTGNCLQSIEQAVDDWVTNFAANNPDWVGNVFKYQDSTERWVNYAQRIATETYSGQNLATKDIIVLSFCNEASPAYHGNSLTGTIPAPTGNFTADYNNFLTLYNLYNSFLGIHYPIVFGNGSGGCGTGGGDIPASRQFVLHSLAALKGDSFTASEASALPINPGFTPAEFAVMQIALQTANPYPTPGLEDFGWLIKSDRAADAAGNVIDAEQFQEDITELLEGTVTVEEFDVVVNVPVTTFEFVDGEVITDPVVRDNSWTMSYSLKENHWVSWHSYLPSFYFYILEDFYSWKQGIDNIWIHNVKGNYQTFYGEFYPHILEYVSLSTPLLTRIWEDITIQTEAKRYDEDSNYFIDERFITFNKLIAYNTRQATGLLNLQVKDTQVDAFDYLSQQVSNSLDTIIIDRNERDWFINDLRDIRVDYNQPIFRQDPPSLESEYFIDKILNDASLDFNKDWSQLESFRDKYLVLRLIFDNFDNIRLITNYSLESENKSHR